MIEVSNISSQLIKHSTKSYKPRELSQITTAMIHHSATKNGRAASYARYHVNNLNWPAIGYHLVGDADGIHQTNEFDVVSWHTSGHNTNSIGICHTGNFDLREPTDNEYWSYIQMIIFAEIELKKRLIIDYHHKHSYKSCPGLKFDEIKFLRVLNEFRILYHNY